MRDASAEHHDICGVPHPHEPRDGAIAELADKQHGVAAYTQLVALGYSRRAIEHLLATRWLHHVQPGRWAV